jgi:hypothetical protein
MKRILAIVLLMVFGFISFAQSTGESKTTGNGDEMKTLFKKNEKIKVGWFVGIDPGYTQFRSKDTWLVGLSTGVIINHNFILGLTGRAWPKTDQLYFEDVADTGVYLEGGYGGLLIEYTLFPKSVVHVTFPVLIGAGGVNYVTCKKDDDNLDDHHRKIDSKAFFVVEPGVRAEINLFKFMRLNAGVSYRYAPNFQLINTSKDMINSFTGTIGLKFGKF